MKKLFIICPECHLEQTIRDHFKEDAFFSSALGGCLHLKYEDSEELYHFILEQKIGELYLVNSASCTFIKNIIGKEPLRDTPAEEHLNSLYLDNLDDFVFLDSEYEQKIKLAKLNLSKQAELLNSAAYIGNMIDNGELEVKKLLFEGSKDEIIELS